MRTSGILLPVSALPSDYAIGTFGKEAYDFVDFLSDSDQHFWQILPLGHTGYGNSPYQCFSAFAGNPYYIDPLILFKSGYIEKNELPVYENNSKADYGRLYGERINLLKKAADMVDEKSSEFTAFEKENKFWLEDYALFMSVKEAQDMKPLKEWQEEIRLADGLVLENLRREFKTQTRLWKNIQFLFYEQWRNLKLYANTQGVEIIGDVPIYVSADSSEMWLHRELFITDDDGNPALFSGCPPDEYAPLGQLWGNPVYDWVSHRKSNYSWWIERMRHSGRLFDMVRIDHFRGFEDFYAVSSAATDAVSGEWYKGPSKEFIDALKRNVPEVRVLAEDLGNITDRVRDLVCYSDFPGMKILQFGFEGSEEYLPHSYTRHSVAYTGTHDNPTMKQWSLICDDEALSFAKKYLDVNNNVNLVNDCIRALFMSVSDTVIIPIQDWLELGSEARMNVPSTSDGNWVWRLSKEMLTSQLSERIADMTRLYNRTYKEEK
ncbi:MAG: 4-alpha-glucanotransferase [Acutalibacteraceae bacterium]|nr:4-alpha-glucanotransferase [Acutalibacteraceae bacterium]